MTQKKVNTDDFQLSQDLAAGLKFWWLIPALMLIGALAGWGANFWLPVQYEARAVIDINIDIARTGTLTGENQDILVNAAGGIIDSYPIMAALYQELQEDSPALPADDLKRMFSMERMAESFALRVQSPDADTALKMADEWSRLALAALDNASGRALEAEVLSRYLDSLTACLSAASAAAADTPTCSISNLQTLQTEIAATGSALQDAKDGARGLTAGINYSLNQPAQLLAQPVQNNRLQLLLGGALIGCVCALWMLHNRRPARLFRRRSH